MTAKPLFLDLSTYEIDRPPAFVINVFVMRARGGLDGFWGTCLEDAPDFKRLRGVILPEYVRVHIDIREDAGRKFALCTTPQNQAMTPRQVADRVIKILGGLKMYHEGKEVVIH